MHEFIEKRNKIRCMRRMHHREFDQYHRRIRYFRPFALIFNLVIVYLLFRWLGIHAISIFFVAVISIKEIVQLYFLRRLEKRIMQPIDKLKTGVEEVAKGNYDVKIECNVANEIGLLIASFNEMAQKLRESEKMKIEYEDNRKAFIANITHDLKTPITSIQGYMEAIVDRAVKSPEDIEKYLKIIYSNTTYMNKLIDDLFLFSKLDMDKVEFNMEDVHISLYMADLMEELKLELEEKRCRFQYNNKMEHNCIVKIDGKRIYQAIRNIIGNAVKYGPENDLSIRAEVYQQGEYVCIGIKDNGPGIPEDKLPRIFDRFYRIDTERTKDLMSTGLGLSIARELVEAHGGRITVSSIESEGSCFTVLLPISKQLRDGVYQ